MSDTLNLAAIEARLNAATPGPWECRLDPDKKAAVRNWRAIFAPASRASVVTEDYYEGTFAGKVFTNCGVRISEPNAALIAHAPEDLRALLAEVCWLTEEREESAATLAFNAIATACGCAHWEYPGQVVRDVLAVVKERDNAVDAFHRCRQECDEARAELATARLDGARAMREAALVECRKVSATSDARGAVGGTQRETDRADGARACWSRVETLDPAAVVGSAPIASPALGCAACPNFVAEGGNAGGWRCRAVDDSIVVGLWIDGATGATNGYMPDGSAGEVPTDARTCPAFGKPAVVGSGS